MFLKGMRQRGAVSGYSGLGPGYGGGVWWVGWRGRYGGYSGKVQQWVQWRGTVHTEDGVLGYGEIVVVQSRGEEGRYTCNIIFLKHSAYF